MDTRTVTALMVLVVGLVACTQPVETVIDGMTVEPLATAVATAESLVTAFESSPTAEIATTEDPFAAERQAMVREGINAWGIDDAVISQVMGSVPRHEFVPEAYLAQAYENHPLPIGYGQTISQPYIVALMTQAAEVEAGDIVLEIGTGSGYQAAVLARLAAHVYSMEIIEALAESSRATLARLGSDNVTVRYADGYFGWEEQAPFDAIVVTAAPDHVPQPLVQQLKIGGHLIIPVGPVGGVQTLWRITRTGEEEVVTENLGAVTFVPLTRQQP